MTQVSRRHFLARSLPLSSAAAVCSPGLLAAAEDKKSTLPIVVFSKVYQELKLNFDEAAALTAEAGLDGIDCPVRPGGEVLPERVVEDLPRYAEALRRRQLGVPLITTAIMSTGSPHAEDVLRTAKRLGVQFYRLGFVYRDKDVPIADQVRAVRDQLKGLAPLNKSIGIGALVQNHSASGRPYLAGDLSEMRDLVAGFDPAEIGVAFDIGHALITHGDDWRAHFEALKAQIKIIYIKDAKRGGRWVPFGQGDVGKTDYFKLLKKTGYDAPISLHIEFEWAGEGKRRTREALLKALKESAKVLRGWLA